ncbi:A4/G1 family peptidase [Aspergillus clavatus NRRL 1]|uniref:Aspergillopepsin, putaitve n=1 Tax=Aspergillus clavatus (strain ATCC 1007 / CBS 513.65 / DSM 816 / NCTC 3887 / NRRL 1 / QM 1276 / 107) TaxID=344612 RepID=A1CGC0_ASPCL|nr:aspergillopepsin, putative [Aspergillus clavatus NRRL 1]EAW11000.1 aspergillopepsin, putaitve [Aspergillus clavatus NRRL 1]
MKLSANLIAAVLAGTALAAPSDRTLERIRARALARQSHPLDSTAPAAPAAEPHTQFRTATTDASPNITWSKNWAGAVREKPPPGASYTAVTATFTVPEATAVAGVAGMQAGSAWVGIDGDTYPTAILQAGVDFYVEDGKHTYDAWYEWFPDVAYDFRLPIARGDVLVVKVESRSPAEGVAIIENRTSRQTVTKTLRAPAPTATLAGQNADWIVEDFQYGDGMVQLVDFDSLAFSGAVARAGGKSYGVRDATIVEMEQNGKRRTRTTVVSNTELVVEYLRE